MKTLFKFLFWAFCIRFLLLTIFVYQYRIIVSSMQCLQEVGHWELFKLYFQRKDIENIEIIPPMSTDWILQIECCTGNCLCKSNHNQLKIHKVLPSWANVITNAWEFSINTQLEGKSWHLVLYYQAWVLYLIANFAPSYSIYSVTY